MSKIQLKIIKMKSEPTISENIFEKGQSICSLANTLMTVSTLLVMWADSSLLHTPFLSRYSVTCGQKHSYLIV